jgi:hypothetical protein
MVEKGKQASESPPWPPEIAEASGGDEAEVNTKGRTVLGLPKHFVAAAREAGGRGVGAAPPAGPAAPSMIIPGARVSAPSAPASAGPASGPRARPARRTTPDASPTVSASVRRATPAASPGAPAASAGNFGAEAWSVAASSEDPPEDPTDVEIVTEMPGYTPTLKASAADLASFAAPQPSRAPSSGRSAAARAPTAAQAEDPLLSTDLALREEKEGEAAGAKIAGIGIKKDLAGKDADAGRVRLIAGRQIPGTRYRLLKWLGEGGMGVVYEAQHIDIERKVAMKILRLDLSQHADTARIFRDEARAANRVGSRNIVQIHDFGEMPDGRLYFCMELLSGFDLTVRRDQGIDAGELIGVLRQVCKGLGAAHAAGIVHRDIKPENILLVEEDGRAGMVKIVDFGVATILGGEGGSQIAGTPQYMAPEQIAGGDFDGRVDMYALGCTAYEMMVGHPPFDGDSLEQVLMGHIQEAPRPPREAAPDRSLPAELEAVVMRCLAKEPGDRYADMADLEAALCEAQVAAGLTSAWDDLPLPDVAPERRAAIAALWVRRDRELEAPRRRWLWPLVAGLAVFISVGVTLMVVNREPTAAVLSEVDRVATEALEAAASARWVISDDPQEATALQKVTELEALRGELEEAGDSRAEALREQFSTTLVSLGDQLWERGEGVRDFAIHYYEWARLFDPTHPRANERSVLSEVELATMRRRLIAGDYRESDISWAEVAAAAVEPDEVKKEALVVKATKRRKMSSVQRAALDEQLAAIGVDEAVRASALGEAPAAKTPPPPPPPPPVDAPPAEAVEPVSAGKAGKKSAAPTKATVEKPPPEDADLEKAARDPAKAAELSGEGKAALSRGDRPRAETLFHQALASDSRNTEALMGLSDIYFDRGTTQKAISYAEKAVKIDPNNKAFRIKLGDAFFAALRYNDAQIHYKRAAELGEPRAAGRLDKVKAKLGE